jgi:hypothetical protein
MLTGMTGGEAVARKAVTTAERLYQVYCREHAFAPCHLISTMISNNDATLIIHTPMTRSH